MKDFKLHIQNEFSQYKDAFSEALGTTHPLLSQVLNYIHQQCGKHLRPILVLLSAAICRGITSKTLQTAVVLELTHTASLIHDDVVDNSPTRRGSNAVHQQWSNKVAILTGDYILAKVIALLSELRNANLLNIVSSMSKSLTEGELLQLHAGDTMWISEKQYYQIIEQKTACLFAACSEAGAASSGATCRQITALRKYGLHLGMCFQVKDDILDYSDIEDIGKPTMNDIQDGKATLPLLISLQRASKEEAALIRAKAEALASKSTDINIFETEQDIKSFVLRYDGIRYAHQEMEKHRKKALEALSIFPDSKYKESLIALLDYAINRVK
jgi:octaprenyl-diphosphate synthase